MAKLRLGSLPDDRPVRITITMSVELQGRLQAYADAWAAETGRTIELPKIIPAIVRAIHPLRPRICSEEEGDAGAALTSAAWFL